MLHPVILSLVSGLEIFESISNESRWQGESSKQESNLRPPVSWECNHSLEVVTPRHLPIPCFCSLSIPVSHQS